MKAILTVVGQDKVGIVACHLSSGVWAGESVGVWNGECVGV